MHILYLATDIFAKGGIQRYSNAQIKSLQEHNICVFSVHPPQPGGFEQSTLPDYVGSGVSLGGRLAFLWKTFAYVARFKPDIIWVNHVYLLPLVFLIRWVSADTKIVVNVYGLELWSGREEQIKRNLSRVDGIVSDCYFSSKYIQETYGVPAEKVGVIWDPVDIERFVPKPKNEDLFQKYGIPYSPEYCYVLTLGRLSAGAMHKGYDRLLDAMHSLRNHPNLFCLIGGDGDQKKRLEQRVASEGLSSRIFFLGNIPEAQLVDIYNMGDIFSLVSDRGTGRGEGIPLTPLEAAACAKPILVGNEDGSQEAVLTGENGFVVSPARIDEYCQRIQELYSDRKLRLEMGEKAKNRIENEFSAVIFAKKHADFLNILFPTGTK